MKVLIGIITFNPKEDVLKKVVKSVIEQGSEVITAIIDNGSSNLGFWEEDIEKISNITLIKHKRNEGVAKALNELFFMAIRVECEWVLTLDQDTIIPKGLLNNFLATSLCLENCAIISPRFRDKMTGEVYPKVKKTGNIWRISRCITSASFNNVSVWKEVGGFDEFLFIDEVDHEYCYRVSQAGYHIYLLANEIVEHQIGNTEIHYVLGKKIYIRNHSPKRKYYISRNIIYIQRKRGKRLPVLAVMHSLMFTLKTCIYEKNKKEKLVCCLRGIRDGILDKLPEME